MEWLFHCEIFERGFIVGVGGRSLPESYCGGLGTSPYSIVTEALLYKKHVSLPGPSQKNSKL